MELKIKIKTYKKNSGKSTAKYRFLGNKKKYRQISFNLKYNFLAIIFNIEYDPNRNCNIGLCFNLASYNFFYVIAAKGLVPGNIIKSGFYSENKTGHCMTIRKIPIGCCVFNIAKFARSAGTFCIIISKLKHYAVILLPSGKIKRLPLSLFATIGTVSNHSFFLKKLNKAGKSYWLGNKPTVRGVAKNPVDHPNGGGEGKKSGKRKTPWGNIMPSKKNENFLQKR